MKNTAIGQKANQGLQIIKIKKQNRILLVFLFIENQTMGHPALSKALSLDIAQFKYF